MKTPKIKTKHLLNLSDLTKEEILHLFEFTAKIKKENACKRNKKYLKNKTLAMIFEKSSTRTRVSFETGMLQLGGHALFLNTNDIQIGRGESIADTARVLSRYIDAIMFRTSSHNRVVDLAKNASVPVINGLSDDSHPCQALADFFSIYEIEKDFGKVKLAYIGDGNNVANSLIEGAAILGMDIAIACPKQFEPDKSVVAKSMEHAKRNGSQIIISSNIDEALKGANFLYTDVWVSMGQEKESAKKKKALARYKISKETLAKCAPGCCIMHCLPAHRGDEIDSDVMDSAKSIIFEQAENRLHVQKAVLCALVK